MGNHGDCFPEEATSIRLILESYGFEVTEMRFKDKVDYCCPLKLQSSGTRVCMCMQASKNKNLG